MRFLCLHGGRTNSRIFKVQTGRRQELSDALTNKNNPGNSVTAAIRSRLNKSHTFEFIEGDWHTSPAPGVERIVEPQDEFVGYADPTTTKGYRRAVLNVERFIEKQGPFDAVMGYCQGSSIAASILVHKMQEDARRQRLKPIFQCAVFFAGMMPYDFAYSGLGAEPRAMNFKDDGEVIDIPTAHVWGAHDREHPNFGLILSRLCRSDLKVDCIHDLGHKIPNAKSPDVVSRAAEAIEKTVDRASSLKSQHYQP